MSEVISIKFSENGNEYFFDPEGKRYSEEQIVVVETSKGIECGTICRKNCEISDDKIAKPLKKILRAASASDLARIAENKEKAKKAFNICEKKIAERGLDMKLVDVKIPFESNKIIFYFTSEARVDFRELVRDLASAFHTRIELLQIGVRDEAKMLGGLGICGQGLCCSRYLNEFQPVSIKMAKEQGLSLNPTKISGSCGRLMCCLKYEQDAYEYLNSLTPKKGSLIVSEQGEGTVEDVNLLTGMLTVRPQGDEGMLYKIHRDKVKKVKRRK